MPLRAMRLSARLLWLGVAAAIMLFTWARFKFTTAAGGAARRKRRQPPADAPPAAAPAGPLPAIAPRFDASTTWTQFLRQTRIETIGALRSVPFLIMLFVGLLNVF